MTKESRARARAHCSLRLERSGERDAGACCCGRCCSSACCVCGRRSLPPEGRAGATSTWDGGSSIADRACKSSRSASSTNVDTAAASSSSAPSSSSLMSIMSSISSPSSSSSSSTTSSSLSSWPAAAALLLPPAATGVEVSTGVSATLPSSSSRAVAVMTPIAHTCTRGDAPLSSEWHRGVRA